MLTFIKWLICSSFHPKGNVIYWSCQRAQSYWDNLRWFTGLAYLSEHKITFTYVLCSLAVLSLAKKCISHKIQLVFLSFLRYPSLCLLAILLNTLRLLILLSFRPVFFLCCKGLKIFPKDCFRNQSKQVIVEHLI